LEENKNEIDVTSGFLDEPSNIEKIFFSEEKANSFAKELASKSPDPEDWRPGKECFPTSGLGNLYLINCGSFIDVERQSIEKQENWVVILVTTTSHRMWRGYLVREKRRKNMSKSSSENQIGKNTKVII
jgi:hypothetical protein